MYLSPCAAECANDFHFYPRDGDDFYRWKFGERRVSSQKLWEYRQNHLVFCLLTWLLFSVQHVFHPRELNGRSLVNIIRLRKISPFPKHSTLSDGKPNVVVATDVLEIVARYN